MAVVDIGAYKNKPLDSPAIQLITQILDFFQQNEKDLILRFVYDCEGSGLLHEPALFSLIEEHIQQLTPVLCAYTKTVFVLQGMFLGSWGEMHGSKFLTPMYLKKLGERMKAAAGVYTWLAVRKPSQWRVLHSTDVIHGQIGLFNDGIFGSDTDLGTFGTQSRAEAFWEDPWCAQDELAFEELLCCKVPHGGEVVWPQENPDLTDTEILHKLRRMHITYLNCVHDLRLLDVWKQKKSPWPNVSLYDYVGAHLGYRFCLRAVKLQKKKRQLQMEVTVENTCAQPFYLRIRLTNGIEGPQEPVENVFAFETNTADWTLREDGCYYYNKVLEPGQRTTPLFKEVEMVWEQMHGRFFGQTLTLTVTAEAVQSKNNPVDHPWEAQGWPEAKGGQA